MKILKTVAALLWAACLPAFATVNVTSPVSSLVGQQVHVVASASASSCARGVAAMGIYVDNVRKLVVQGESLDTHLALPLGTHQVVVEEWDFCRHATTKALALTVSFAPTVSVTAPANGSTFTASAVSYTASASAATCARGVAAMGVYDGTQLVLVTPTPDLKADVPLTPGVHQTTVQEWDFCGGSAKQAVSLTVLGVPPPPPPPPVPMPAYSFRQIQASVPWSSWGQQGPAWQDCDPCAGDTWSMQQGSVIPTLSGSAAQFNLGGTAAYSDVLFANHLIGPFSSQGQPDSAQSIVPALHHFTYTGDFYTATGERTYALELDVNSFPGGGVGMTFGTQCRIFGGHGWDVWDSQHWIQTGKACNPVENGWNHFSIDVTRGPSNELTYNTITLNDVVNTIGLTYPPFAVPADWYGVTVNVQLDGDNVQHNTSVVVDNLTLTAN